VPDYITVTHQVPIATQIPVVEFGITELRDILSTSPSLEVIAVTALKSTDVSNSPVIYANAQTISPKPGVKDILFDALKATETTSVIFTPTRIRGRKTSFSHIVPSTIYNVETITTQTVEPIDQNLLLNSLLQHLLLGQANTNPLAPTPLIPNNPTPQTTGTQLITHTSTYVTTITEEESTVLPITLRGRAITTTIVESSTKVVTATEYSTETITHTPIAPTQALPQIIPTQAAGLASLLPALLGNPLFNNPQQAAQQQAAAALQQQALQQQALQQAQQQQALQQALLAKQMAEQQLLKQQQEALNEQLLAEINLDDFTDEDLANLDIDAVLAAVSGKSSPAAATGVLFPKKNLFNAAAPPVAPSAVAAPPAGPRTSLVTIFKSGTNPGEFSSVVSTVFLGGDSKRLKREAEEPPTLLQPSKPIVTDIAATELPDINNVETLGGARGPLDIQIYGLGLTLIEPSMRVKTLDSSFNTYPALP